MQGVHIFINYLPTKVGSSNNFFIINFVFVLRLSIIDFFRVADPE